MQFQRFEHSIKWVAIVFLVHSGVLSTHSHKPDEHNLRSVRLATFIPCSVDKVFYGKRRFDALTIPIYLSSALFSSTFQFNLLSVSLFRLRLPHQRYYIVSAFFSPSIIHTHKHSIAMNHKDDWLRLNKELAADELALIYVCISTFRHCRCAGSESCAVLWCTVLCQAHSRKQLLCFHLSSTCPVADTVTAMSVVFDECFIIRSKKEENFKDPLFDIIPLRWA